MILRLSSVLFTSSINLGEAAFVEGEPRLEPGTYVIAERHKVQLFLDADTRLVHVFHEGAKREIVSIPVELVQRLDIDDPRELLKLLPIKRTKTLAKVKAAEVA